MYNIENLFQNYDGYRFIDGDKPLKNLKNYIGKEKKEWNTEDLALVHLTNYFPNNKIVSSFEGGKISNGFLMIDGKKYNYSVPQYRNTIHFTLNGPVESHPYGSWNKMNYVVIEPLKYHINDVINLSTVDTYFYKSLKLSKDAFILIRKDVFDSIDKKLLDGKNIIVFSGNQNNVVNEILLYLGYSPQKIGMHNWVYESLNGLIKRDKIQDYQEKQRMINPKLTFDMHSGSMYDIISKNQWEISRDLSIIKKGKIVSIKNEYKITAEELLNVYKIYLKTNDFVSDNIDCFKKFIEKFHINFNDNKEIVIHSVDKWYNDQIKNNITEKNMIKTIYNDIKKIEQTKIEYEKQKKEHKIQEFQHSVKKRMLNMTCGQALKLCEKFSIYKTQLIGILNNLLKIDFSLENIGIPKRNKISYSYLMKYISIGVEDDNFFYYLAEDLTFKNHFDESLRIEVDLSNMKISEIRDVLYNYQRYISEQAVKYVSKTNIKEMGYIKISYIVILLSLFLIILFAILLILLF